LARRISIAAKFFLTYFVITGAALAFAGVAGYLQFKRYVIEEADASLKAQALLAAESFRPLLAASEPDREAIAREGDRLGDELDTRLTVILPVGEVVADSRIGSAHLGELENHADRPEVREALSGQTGFSHRRSISLKVEQWYCAVPILSGGRIVGVARTSFSGDILNRRLYRVRVITWGTGFAAFLLMLLGTAIRARAISSPLEEIRKAALEFSAGNRSRRLRLRTGDELEDVASALNQTAAQLEQAISLLDAQKVRLATLLENLSEGVIVIAGGRTVRMMNREAARILGAAAIPPEGLPYAEVIRQPDLLRFIDGWKDGRAIPPKEITVPSPGGEIATRVSATILRYPSGRDSDILFTLRDVTEEKRLARVKSDFVSNASHELRTPLTNIRGYLEALQDSASNGTSPDPSFLAIVLANVHRMEDLVNDLLTLSRAEFVQEPLAGEEIPLPVFLDRVASLHQPSVDRLGKTLAVEAEEATLVADLKNLTLAISNIVDNAIRHGVRGGKIRLTGRVGNGAIVLSVEDDGPGIPKEHLPRIFERFYRVDKGRSREVGGTGLGLAIAKHIIESHGGTIRVESTMGTGTRFIVRIPAS
jgi:two-component system, OmpR family, phosphate regulon sensor histidine kinase PhoR